MGSMHHQFDPTNSGEANEPMSNIAGDAVTLTHFDARKLPLIISPSRESIILSTWAQAKRELIHASLLKNGGILFRNFLMNDIVSFNQFVSTISEGLLDYRERSSPRSQVSEGIYTSTDYPANQSIFLHNENSYQQTWPLKIFFYCNTPAQTGGETPIADTRRIFAQIDLVVRERFIEKKVMYVRNFGDGFGLPWQEVFQTTHKHEVEAYCRNAHIECQWKSNNRLRTRQIRPVVARHPQTGETVWFNHATFFHVSTLETSIRDLFLAGFKEEDLPSNTYYGDGLPIEPEVLNHLREIYHQETVKFPWQTGDILLLDNMLVAHGREPFRGPRKILVAMSEPVHRDDI